MMHLGRVAMCVALGALAGWLGQMFWRQQWLPIQRGLFALAGVMLLLQAMWLVRARDHSAMGQWIAARTAGLWRQLCQ